MTERITERWRLILDLARDGALNMAIDEMILKRVGANLTPPTLRLYRWQTPCLSLGYAQHSTDADLDRLKAREWEIVRRLTGGRAILHTDEITYSVCLPLTHPLAAGTVVDSYRRLSSALLEALSQLGSEPNATTQMDKSKTFGPICFEVPSKYELTINGKKLIGSAQRRDSNGVLQHGSLPLCGDLSRICDVLDFGSDSARQAARGRVLQRATTLADAVGHLISWEQVAAAITAAFESTFGITFEVTELDSAEMQEAQALRRSRYAAEAWTLHL